MVPSAQSSANERVGNERTLVSMTGLTHIRMRASAVRTHAYTAVVLPGSSGCPCKYIRCLIGHPPVAALSLKLVRRNEMLLKSVSFRLAVRLFCAVHAASAHWYLVLPPAGQRMRRFVWAFGRLNRTVVRCLNPWYQTPCTECVCGYARVLWVPTPP